MKSVRFVLAGIALLVLHPASAEVDFTCQSKCMDMGYMMDFCTEKCTYGQSRQRSNNGYQPSGALGAYQQGQRDADNEARQQNELIKQRLEIQKMKQELEMMKNNQQKQ